MKGIVIGPVVLLALLVTAWSPASRAGVSDPSLTVGKNALTGEVALSWTDSGGPYTVVRSGSASGDAPAFLALGTPDTSFADPVLPDGTTYFYTIEDQAQNCGNGKIDAGEVCDGTELAGATCGSEGFNSGTPGCSADCRTLEIAGCFDCAKISADPDLSDAVAPSAPDGLAVQAELCGRLELTWSGSEDTGGSGFAGFKVYRDASELATTTGRPEFLSGIGRFYADAGLPPSTTYEYTVSAIDLAGNESGQTAPASATTLAAGSIECTDTQPPSTPTGLGVTPLGCTQVQLSASASTDQGGSGLNGYRFFRNGVFIGRSNVPARSDQHYLLPGETYSYEIRAVDNAGNESGAAQAQITMPACTPAGEIHVGVLLLNFPDWPAEPFTLAEAESLVFAGPWSLRAFYQEISYGQIDLLGAGQIMGWYTMPQNASDYCTFTLPPSNFWYGCDNFALRTDALTVSGFDPAGVDELIFAFYGVGAVGFGGGGTQTLSASNGFSVSVMAHEMGHSQGNLAHAGRWDCGDQLLGQNVIDPPLGCFLHRYGDRYDSMGAGNNFHFSSFKKQQMGVLDPSAVTVVERSDLRTLDQVELASTGFKELRIPLERETFYTFEYRTPVGFDGQGESPAPIDGVLGRVRFDAYPGTDVTTGLIDLVVHPGQPFVDTIRGVQVELLSSDGAQASLRVCLDCTADADCDDHLFCTGVETCVDGLCGTTGPPCTLNQRCVEESDSCDVVPVCPASSPCTVLPDCRRDLTQACTTFDTGDSLCWRPDEFVECPGATTIHVSNCPCEEIVSGAVCLNEGESWSCR